MTAAITKLRCVDCGDELAHDLTSEIWTGERVLYSVDRADYDNAGTPCTATGENHRLADDLSVREQLTDTEKLAASKALLAAADEWDAAQIAGRTPCYSITPEQIDTYQRVIGDHGIAHARPVSDWLREIAGDLIGGAS